LRIDIDQLEFIDVNLRTLLIWVEEETGFDFTITSLYRISDSGVHGTLPLRGCDLRMRDYAIATMIEGLVNESWFYDTERPDKKCAIAHGDHKNFHLHLQVHPNTDLDT